MRNNNILIAFKESISDSLKVKKALRDNLFTHKQKTIRMNLVYVEYNFDQKQIKIDYYVKDENYPSMEISFNDFEKLIN